MNRLRLIADMVLDRGSATCDELYEELKDYEWTRSQVFNAMKNASRAKLIHCLGHTSPAGIGQGSDGARYYPGEKSMKVERPERGCAPPASVWELGDRELRPWPPVGEGRKFNLLGPWDAA